MTELIETLTPEQSALPSDIFKNAVKERFNKNSIIDIKKDINKFRNIIHDSAVFYYSEDTVDTFINKEYNTINQIIHFPKTKVINDNGKSTIVYDIYIRMTFNFNTYKLVKVEASKFSSTPEQYNCSYNHSHIKPVSLCSFTDSVCFGDVTDIALYKLRLYTEFSLSDYELFINLLQSWLSYESLSGGPYTKLEGISSSNIRRKFDDIKNNGLTNYDFNASLKIIDKLFNTNIKLIESDLYYYKYKFNIDINYIKEIADTIDHNNKVEYDYLNDEYCFNTNNNTLNIKNQIENIKSNFMFKGELVKPKCIDSNNINTLIKTTHPNIIFYIQNILSKIITAKNENTRIEFI